MFTNDLKIAFTGLLALTVSCSVTNQSRNKIVGNKHIQKVVRNVPPFTSINKSGSLDLILRQAPQQKVTVIAEENIQQYVVTNVKNGELYIKLKKPDVSVWEVHHLKVLVAFKHLKKIIAGGSGDVRTGDTLELQNLAVNKTGSGDMKLLINAGHLKINKSSSGDMNVYGHMQDFTLDADGSGDVNLKGSAGKSDISISGSGDLEGKKFKAQNMILSQSGSGDADVWANQTLSLYSSGSGDVTYNGNAKISQLKKTGSGDIGKE